MTWPNIGWLGTLQSSHLLARLNAMISTSLLNFNFDKILVVVLGMS
jgi:hypothetical protein